MPVVARCHSENEPTIIINCSFAKVSQAVRIFSRSFSPTVMRPVQFAIGPWPTLAGLSATAKPIVIIEVLRDLDSAGMMMMLIRPQVLSFYPFI